MEQITVRFWHFFFIVCVVLVGTARAENAPEPFSDDVGTPSYNCMLTVQPTGDIARKAAVRLVLEAGAGSACTQVTVTKSKLTLAAIGAKPAMKPREFTLKPAPGAPLTLSVLRRGDWLAILHDDKLLFRDAVPRPAGTLATVTADKGWTVQESRVQPLEPVVFADNFMRTADENGGWSFTPGTWALQSAWDLDPKGNANRFNNTVYAQNPFAWVSHAEKDPAFCATGQPFWEDYTLSASVCPAVAGAAGVAVNVADAKNLLLVRWTPGNDRGTGGNTLALYQVRDGKRTLLAESAGGYIPGQWYRLQVTTHLSGVAVLVDGQVRLTAQQVTPWRGGVGLYAEGAVGSVFDDVTVYGSGLHADLLYENQQMYVAKRFVDDKNGMQEWSTSRVDWQDLPGAPNHKSHVDAFYGDYWMTLTVTPAAGTAGELHLIVDGNGLDSTAGYRAVLKQAADETQLVATLFRGTEELVTKRVDRLNFGEDYTLRLRRQAKVIRLELDGDTLLEATDPKPLSGKYPGYFAEGGFSPVKDILATGRNVLDYTFAEAPVDWVPEGTWMPTTRWSCAPHWSFLGGWSDGDAVLWHKKRFTGDQSLETFIGLKMEYPRERQIYDYRYRDFAVTICGDGRNPRSGYTGIYGAPGADGTSNQRAVLMRSGVIVASVPLSVPGRGQSHREWFQLVLRKTGGTVDFWIENKKVLSYTDPQPLAGGVPAIWTNDNGIALARARLIYAQPPQARTDTRVLLDDLWYPEFANVGQALTLDFPHAWSTSGRKVTLKSTTVQAPKGDESAVTIDGAIARFLPSQLGPHHYSVTAVDGELASPAFHLALPVFDLAKGRDDSHARVLYRFDTPGQVIRDVSGQTPALDIPISPKAPVEWKPGMGLTLHGPVALTATESADRLQSLFTNGAMTLELWVSTDTIYPPNGWSGTLLSVESGEDGKPNKTINVQAIHRSSTFVFGTRADSGALRQSVSGGFRTGLQHIVTTWDGKNAVTYLNGQQVSSIPMPATGSKWQPASRLVLGFANQNYYLGTYYLVALHDIAFTPEQVQRHYQCGPAGR